MRKTRDVLRLRWQSGLSFRQIADSLGLGRSTVGDTLSRAEKAGLGWPLPTNLGSTLIATQLPIKAWHESIGEPTLADAICDRLLHRALRIELRGASLRKTKPIGEEKASEEGKAKSSPKKTG